MLHFGPSKLITILLVILAGVLFSLPNLVPEDERFGLNQTGETVSQGIWRIIPANSINLGLDLQGGSHIVFEVDMDEVREKQLEARRDDAESLMRDRERGFLATRSISVVGDEVVVMMANAEDRAEAYDRLEDLVRPIDGQFGQITFANTIELTRDADDDRVIRIRVTDEQFESIKQRTLAQSIEVVRQRLDGMGTVDPTIAPEGDDRVLVQVPGADDPDVIIDTVGQAAVMTFHLVDETIDPGPTGDARVPPGRMILPVRDTNNTQFEVVHTRETLSGENLTDARVVTGGNYAGPVIQFTFDTEGALIFGNFTRQHVGERFAVVLDGEVVTAPRIRGPILGGTGIIEGSYTYETANREVILLNAGALPASLTPVSQFNISPTLGQDQIEKGQLAIMIGFAAVIVFMIAAYGMFGLFSTTALLANVVLIIGALSGLGATLTLPGIAGIILTIGMAVDANVLIYERIREESRVQGRTPALAIQAGYERALAAILDANITTFIAAGVLIMLGAGPVRGFAITLGIGIVTSVFTAFVFSRLLAVLWLRAFKPKTLPL